MGGVEVYLVYVMCAEKHLREWQHFAHQQMTEF